jgi:mannose-6-phosphate isomerase
MGTHPSNPSRDLTTSRTLLSLIEDNISLLSPSLAEKFGTKLPFLFKVLSVGKALSIQAHPDKALAEQLHKRDPKNYPDDNHKPEMTIAITPFEGLCGFRPLGEIAQFLKSVKSLRGLVGEEEATEFEKTVEAGKDEATNKKALKAIFASLMASKPEEIEAAAKELISAAESQGDEFANGGPESSPSSQLVPLLKRLNTQFPHDLGLFLVFLLNLVTLQPGEAMFLRADDIHAYLSGDIIECMAASDNVVRAGFTPKFKDVDTLVEMLTYDTAPIEEQKMTPTEYSYATLNTTAYTSGSSMALYDPPIEEFSVIKTELKKRGAKATFEAIAGPSIVLCTSGKGYISVGPKVEEIQEGWVYFVGATAELVLESNGEEGETFTTFKAFCDLEGKEDEGAKEKL